MSYVAKFIIPGALLSFSVLLFFTCGCIGFEIIRCISDDIVKAILMTLVLIILSFYSLFCLCLGISFIKTILEEKES